TLSHRKLEFACAPSRQPRTCAPCDASLARSRRPASWYRAQSSAAGRPAQYASISPNEQEDPNFHWLGAPESGTWKRPSWSQKFRMRVPPAIRSRVLAMGQPWSITPYSTGCLHSCGCTNFLANETELDAAMGRSGVG